MKWKLVPVEPTPEMVDAAWDSKGADYVGWAKYIHSASDAYKAMLEAAPKPPALSDVDISLIADNLDEGDWNDLRFRDAWHEGFLRGFREAQRELLGVNLEVAPKPPALTDERIIELWKDSLIDCTQTDALSLARAIERELLGENK